MVIFKIIGMLYPLYIEADLKHSFYDGLSTVGKQVEMPVRKATGPKLLWGSRKDGWATVVKRKPEEIP